MREAIGCPTALCQAFLRTPLGFLRPHRRMEQSRGRGKTVGQTFLFRQLQESGLPQVHLMAIGRLSLRQQLERSWWESSTSWEFTPRPILGLLGLKETLLPSIGRLSLPRLMVAN